LVADIGLTVSRFCREWLRFNQREKAPRVSFDYAFGSIRYIGQSRRGQRGQWTGFYSRSERADLTKSHACHLEQRRFYN